MRATVFYGRIENRQWENQSDSGISNGEAPEWRHNSDKQTGMVDDCFLQTRKPSVFQNHVFETKPLPTFLLFLSKHA